MGSPQYQMLMTGVVLLAVLFRTITLTLVPMLGL
jgi:hypothetical protein